MFEPVVSLLGRWGFLYIDLALAAILFWLSYRKQRKFLAAFGVALVLQGLTQLLQELGHTTAGQVFLVLFWAAIIMAVLVFIREFKDFSAYMKRRQKEVEEAEGEDEDD